MEEPDSRGGGFLGIGGFLVFGLLVCRHTVVHSNESSTRNIAPLASVISETGAAGEYSYLMGTGSDQNLSILQSLTPDQSIQMEKNNGKERAEFYEEVRNGERAADVIITGTGEGLVEETMPEELPEYPPDLYDQKLRALGEAGKRDGAEPGRKGSGRLQ